MQIANMTAAEILEERIANRTARVGIIGLGYVGLPLAVEFAKAGFAVTGIDVQESKVASLNAGESYVKDVPTAVLRPLVEAGQVLSPPEFSGVAEPDNHKNPGAPPPRETKKPDLSYLVMPFPERPQ